MGSYENIIKLEEMRKRVDEGDLLSAQAILDTIERKKIKNNSDLNLIARVYYGNKKYEEASELCFHIYKKVKTRKSLYHLIEVLIKLNNTKEAQEYLEEYQKIAPKDFYNYIFRYQIDKLNGEPFEKLIATLEELKHLEYTEQWAYELAKLYYKAGLEEKCIQECSDIELWFGEGIYVEKAKILKSYYSGEADKDKIMEQIKRRAKAIHNYEDQEDEVEDQSKEQAEDQEEAQEDQIEGKVESLKEQLEDQAESQKDQKDQTDLRDNQAVYRVDKEETVKKHLPDISELYTMESSKNQVEGENFESDLKKEILNYMEDEPENDLMEEGYSYNQEELGHQEYAYNEAYGTYDDEYTDDESVLINKAELILQQVSQEYEIALEDIFGSVIDEQPIKIQLANLLENVMTKETEFQFILITGRDSTRKAAMTKSIALLLYKIGKLNSTKIAKIKGEKLNRIDIKSKKETLRNCCAIIEEANEITRETMDNFLELCKELQGEIVVILEEKTENIDRMTKECPVLMNIIKNRISLDKLN